MGAHLADALLTDFGDCGLNLLLRAGRHPWQDKTGAFTDVLSGWLTKGPTVQDRFCSCCGTCWHLTLQQPEAALSMSCAEPAPACAAGKLQAAAPGGARPVRRASSVSLGDRIVTCRSRSAPMGPSSPPQSMTTVTPCCAAICAPASRAGPPDGALGQRLQLRVSAPRPLLR